MSELNAILDSLVREAQQPAQLGPQNVIAQPTEGRLGPGNQPPVFLPDELGPLDPATRGPGFGPVFVGGAILGDPVDPSGGLVGPAQENPTLLAIRDKFFAGQDLTPGELDFILDQGGNPADVLLTPGQRTFLQSAGQLGTAVAVPTITGAGGAALGSLLSGGNPAGGITGAAVGSGIGTAINQFFGLEREDDFNLLVSFLLPGAIGGGQRLLRSGAGLTRTARIADEVRGIQLASRLADEAVTAAPGRQLVAQRVAILDSIPTQLPLRGASTANLPRLGEVGLKAIADDAGASIDEVRQVANAVSANPRTLFDFRVTLSNAEEALLQAGRSSGSRQATEAQNIGRLINAVDNHLDDLARNGPTPDVRAAASRVIRARDAVRLRDAQDDMATLVAKHTRSAGGQQQININGFLQEFDSAVAAVERGEPHRLRRMVQLLDEQGDRAQFLEDIAEMRQLAANGRLNVVESATRSGFQAASSAAGAAVNALIPFGEVLTNRVARNVILRVMRQSGGRINLPVLALAGTAGRAAAGNTSAQDLALLEFVREFGRLPEIAGQALTGENLTDVANNPGAFTFPTEEERQSLQRDQSIVGRFRRRTQEALNQ